LEDLQGWYWDKDRFTEDYNKLKNFIEDNERLPMTTSMEKNERSMGKLCYRYREKYNKKVLLKHQIKEMEKLPLWYWKKKLIEQLP
jgi:hypothetical protein